MTTSPETPRLLWNHPSPKSTPLYAFLLAANRKYNLSLSTFNDLYTWSIGSTRQDFWNHLWSSINLIHEGSYVSPLPASPRMDSVGSNKWFEGVRLNYAENMLFTQGPSGKDSQSRLYKEDGKLALTQIREGATPSDIQNVTYGSLRSRVGLLSNALRAHGVKKGDRIAIVASNSIDTLVVFLASTAIGAVFSSSSADMGTKGVLDRLRQIEPVWVFVDDGAVYAGVRIDLREKIGEILKGMEGMRNFQGVIGMQRFDEPMDLAGLGRKVMPMERFLEKGRGNGELVFEKIGYSEPFLIVYSSGTTGVPKCIVHSVGGVLTSALKDGKIQRGLGPDMVGMQYTTTGWIMYLSAVSPLLFGGRSVLYDGSPFHPSPHTFIELLGSQKVTNLGISPRYLHELQKLHLSPRNITDLSSLRSVVSTGMVLKDALFEWVYDVGFPAHVHLCNISGGTDLAGAFGMENPLDPLYVGGCQGPSLGTAIAVYDQLVEGGIGVKGVPVADGTPGELVATKSFPNMPVFFWGKDGDKKYFNSYFARFDDVWTHGDFIMVHPVTKQVFFLGRADGVLNPSGVRFGSAELYSVIESNFLGVADSLCVGQRRPSDNDESVLLFLMMGPGQAFTKELVAAVKDAIAKGLSKRHVPRFVFEVPEGGIPVTINGKKVELPVKQIVSGHIVKPSSTLANPESLDFYYKFAKLEELEKAKL